MIKLEEKIEFGIRVHENAPRNPRAVGYFAQRVLELAAKHDAVCLARCNEGDLVKHTSKQASIENLISAACGTLGNCHAEFQSDPRGPTVVIAFANGIKLPVPQ